MRQYARLVDRALRPVLAGLGLPLILAAAEPLDSIYRSVNSYPQLAARGIAGNPEDASEAELAAAARADPRRALRGRARRGPRERFETRANAGPRRDRPDRRRPRRDLRRRRHADGRHRRRHPGLRRDGRQRRVTFDGDDDAVNYGVVDEIARRVLLSGGRVLALRRDDIPAHGTVAAILRYPV